MSKIKADPEDDDREPRRSYPVRSDTPLEIRDPRRQLVRLAVAFMLGALLLAFAGGWAGYLLASARASAQIDQRVAELEQERDARTAVRDQQAAEVGKILEQNRSDHCALAAQATNPKDPAVVLLRQRNRCTTP